MPILPLPQFEADLAEQDREIYERLKPPSSIVVRFGLMKMVGEFPYDGQAKPGCGSKIVVRTNRGTEIGEMLTSTCPNAGCSKSVTRKEMLQYIENSGGKDYPFFSMQGKVLRIATPEDLNQQRKLEDDRPAMIIKAREIVARLKLNMKIVEAEPILGDERLTFYFTSEDRLDFRELVNALAGEYRTRIELRQVGARDEARLVADYEKCGQHCCCKQFLKVLKPISMKSAKIQKATLDPLKISGRCGRLMCCLRYEDETYDDLRKRLPKKKTRVQTEHGWGFVMDTQILTQLVLVALEDRDEQVAVAVEELIPEGETMSPLARKKAEEQGSACALPGGDDDDDDGSDLIAAPNARTSNSAGQNPGRGNAPAAPTQQGRAGTPGGGDGGRPPRQQGDPAAPRGDRAQRRPDNRPDRRDDRRDDRRSGPPRDARPDGRPEGRDGQQPPRGDNRGRPEQSRGEGRRPDSRRDDRPRDPNRDQRDQRSGQDPRSQQGGRPPRGPGGLGSPQAPDAARPDNRPFPRPDGASNTAQSTQGNARDPGAFDRPQQDRVTDPHRVPNADASGDDFDSEDFDGPEADGPETENNGEGRPDAPRELGPDGQPRKRRRRRRRRGGRGGGGNGGGSGGQNPEGGNNGGGGGAPQSSPPPAPSGN